MSGSGQGHRDGVERGNAKYREDAAQLNQAKMPITSSVTSARRLPAPTRSSVLLPQPGRQRHAKTEGQPTTMCDSQISLAPRRTICPCPPCLTHFSRATPMMATPPRPAPCARVQSPKLVTSGARPSCSSCCAGPRRRTRRRAERPEGGAVLDGDEIGGRHGRQCSRGAESRGGRHYRRTAVAL